MLETLKEDFQKLPKILSGDYVAELAALVTADPHPKPKKPKSNQQGLF
jgi:hypothetical protein